MTAQPWEPCAICGAAPEYDLFPVTGVLPLGMACRVQCRAHLFPARVELVAPDGAVAVDVARRAWNAIQREQGGRLVRAAWTRIQEEREQREDARREMAANA